MSDLKSSIQHVLDDIQACDQEVTLVAVTKTLSVEVIQAAYDCGLRVFGENRVQELHSKISELPSDVIWHLIGHLQSNKVKDVLGRVGLIHSVDRVSLIEAIEKEACKAGVDEVPCLLQVNMAEEDSKFGFSVEELKAVLRKLTGKERFQVRGLMAIGPHVEDSEKVRECFRKMKALFEWCKSEYPEHSWYYLSLGMSADYKIALEEGSNMIRVGSSIFGPRG